MEEVCPFRWFYFLKLCNGTLGMIFFGKIRLLHPNSCRDSGCEGINRTQKDLRRMVKKTKILQKWGRKTSNKKGGQNHRIQVHTGNRDQQFIFL